MEGTFTVEALIEANEILQEEVSRLRNSHRTLRTIISAQRKSLQSLREQVAVAQFNDEVFKAYCNGDFDVKVIPAAEGGLPDTAGVVESSVMNGEETSAPSTSS